MLATIPPPPINGPKNYRHVQYWHDLTAPPPPDSPAPPSSPPPSISFAAFTAGSETTLQVLLGGEVVVESWTGVAGETGLQEIPGLSGYSTDEMELLAVMDEGSYIGITEVNHRRESQK